MRTLLFAIALLAACAPASPPKPAFVPKPKPLLGVHGFELEHIDRAISPCDDFYQYATGGWRAANRLPIVFARYGRFEEVAERNRETLRKILEASANAAEPKGSNARKIGDFWTACMSEADIEAQGAMPIRPDLDRIDAISSRGDVVAEIHRQHQSGMWPLFRFAAQNDIRNSELTIAGVVQAGLGLPDREYYLRDSESFKTTRKAYLEHLTKMFELVGVAPADATADADRVLALETQLARASMARIDMRKPENTYHLTPVSQLQSTAPRLDWASYFRTLGVADLRSLNVAQPEYIAEVNRLLGEVPVGTWKAYLRWNLLDAAAPLLSSQFEKQDFAFRGEHLTGMREMQPRWQRCVRAADQYIGGILGQEYVKRVFTPEAREKINALIDNLIAALREEIPTLTWMEPETKRAGLTKLEAFRRRIGHPDDWIDTSSIEIGRESYIANVKAARAFAVRDAANRVGKPDNPKQWRLFTPSTVNAGYNAMRNDITFPAGILQPPFYDPNSDDAYNYGGIGTVIGHEMTHGFDDQGAKFDASGNLHNWWTAKDLEKFHVRAGCISRQYGAWNVEEGINLQGELVTGEAIADLGGVALALRAYQKSLEGRPRATVDGFTPEQRFFLGFAQVWAQNVSPEEARRRALTDPHAPGHARVNLTLQNVPEFQDTWNCPATSEMVRSEEERCDIW